MHRPVSRGLASLIVGALLLIGLSGHAHAGSLSLEPLRTEVTATSGQATSGKLTVRNAGKESGTVSLSAEAFNVTDAAYDYAFDPKAEITRWVQFDQSSFDLKPGEEKSVGYTIGAPTDAEPGGKYFALIASLQTSNSSDGINPVQRAASLVYLTVPGEMSKKGAIKSINISQLTRSSPVGWSMSIANSGNVHFRSRITTTVRTVWGSKLSEAEENHLILPDSVRLVSGDVTMGRWPGLYKVEFLVGLGDNPTSKQTRWLVYLPVWPTILFGVGLAGMIGLSVVLWRRRATGLKARRYKR